MKRYLWLCLVLLCTACNKNVFESSALQGMWVCELFDGEAISTDEQFIVDFRSDGTQFYAAGEYSDANNKAWYESDDYSYTFDGNTIRIVGTTVFDQKYDSEFEIISLCDDMMSYRVVKDILDEVEYEHPGIYTLRRISEPTPDIVGLWEGRETTEGTANPETHRWEYFANGDYNYYIYNNDLGVWEVKEDNVSNYRQYGNFFASNYCNDYNTQAIGYTYECWIISLTGNTMTWYSLRNNQTKTFEMTRVNE